MTEQEGLTRYRDIRKEADIAAKARVDGQKVKGWHYEWDWTPGQPEPPKVHLEGVAWVAYLFESALEVARLLIAYDAQQYRSLFNDAERVAQMYRERVRSGR